MPITTGLAGAVFTFVFAIIGVFILAFIINALAPTFGAQKDSNKAFKVAVYSYTPAWIAGALQILPGLGILGLLAALYGLYLLYLGLPALMKGSDKTKPVGYTAVVVVCAIVLSIVVASHRRSYRRTCRAGRPGRILFIFFHRTAVRCRQSDGKARGPRPQAGGKRRQDGAGAKKRRHLRRGQQPRSRGWEPFSAAASA